MASTAINGFDPSGKGDFEKRHQQYMTRGPSALAHMPNGSVSSFEGYDGRRTPPAFHQSQSSQECDYRISCSSDADICFPGICYNSGHRLATVEAPLRLSIRIRISRLTATNRRFRHQRLNHASQWICQHVSILF